MEKSLEQLVGRNHTPMLSRPTSILCLEVGQPLVAIKMQVGHYGRIVPATSARLRFIRSPMAPPNRGRVRQDQQHPWKASGQTC